MIDDRDDYNKIYEDTRELLQSRLQLYCDSAICMINLNSTSTRPNATNNHVYISDDGSLVLKIVSDGSQMIINVWDSIVFHKGVKGLITDVYEFLKDWNDADEDKRDNGRYWYNLGVKRRNDKRNLTVSQKSPEAAF